MRYATGIQISEVIIHTLNSKQKNGMELSDRTLPLDSNQRLLDYLIGHIQNSLKDPTSKAARFSNFDEANASGICMALLNNDSDFVQHSKHLASKLYEIMAKNRAISEGNLVVCFFHAANRPQVARYLGLLKIDPSQAFRPKVEYDANNVRYISFEMQSNILPTTRERLQKCAFVQPLNSHNDYHMMLLDRQAQAGKEPAKFFVKDFLGVEDAFDDQQRTDRFYRSVISAINTLRSELGTEKAELIRQFLDTSIASQSINVDSFLQSLPITESQKNRIDEILSQSLPDREFTIDSNYASKLLEKRRFRGDSGLFVEVRSDSYEDIVDVIHPGEAYRPDVDRANYRIVIRTKSWRETGRR